MLLGEEVAAVHRTAVHVVRELAPQRERPAFARVPARERTAGAPECEERTGDASPGLAVGGVVLTIDRRSRAVFLADRMDALAVAQHRHVGGADGLVEGVGRGA